VENLTLERLKGLAQSTQRPSLSIFLPTHRAGQQTEQDPIRFKNLLREAERRLLDRGMGPRDVGALLQPAQALLNDALFWQHQRDGLAVFIARDEVQNFRLPFRVEEQLIFGQAFYVRPILPLFTNNGHYLLLALSQNEVRLFEGTRHSVGQIDLPQTMPSNLDEALRFDDPAKQLQFHTGTPQGGTRAGMFHGHGPGDEEQRVWIEQYLNQVDAALTEILGEQRAPLVLAGVDYLLPIYRKVSKYALIMAEGITGNPEQLRPEELQAQAWPIVEPYFRQELEQVLAQYRKLTGTGQATDNLLDIIRAAQYGRVARLVLAVETPVWGRFDSATGEVVQSVDEQGQEDELPLLDVAAMQTLQNGGKVYALPQAEMPDRCSCLAVLRY
jgi:hypothetical protein